MNIFNCILATFEIRSSRIEYADVHPKFFHCQTVYSPNSLLFLVGGFGKPF